MTMKSLEEKDIILRVEAFSNLILNSSFEQLIEISEKNNKTIEQYLVSNNVENISWMFLFVKDLQRFL